MFLNSHERWLLRVVGLNGNERRTLLAAVTGDGRPGGDIDITAQEGGFKLAKRSVTADLEAMGDRLLDPLQPPVRKVVYGHRRYRRPVIVAAALRHAGVTAATYRRGAEAGLHRLEDFRRMLA